MDENINKDNQPEESREEPTPEDEKSFFDFAEDVFAAAKKAATEAIGNAKDYVQEKADQTDVDEKAADFLRNATETAKSAFHTAADKTK